MAEYTYDNILIDPSKEGIERLIGKEVYCHENPYLCLKNANKKSTDFLGVLMKIHKDSNNPFRVKQNDGIYKYPCIIEKKEELKPQYVPFESPQEFISAYIKAYKEAMPDTESTLYCFGMWLKCKDDNWIDQIVSINNVCVHFGNKEYVTYWDELLENFTFLDGTPCGKEVTE